MRAQGFFFSPQLSWYLGFLATRWHCPWGLTIRREVHFWEYTLEEFLHFHRFLRRPGSGWLARGLRPWRLGAKAPGRSSCPLALLCPILPRWNPSFQLKPLVLSKAPEELGNSHACQQPSWLPMEEMRSQQSAGLCFPSPDPALLSSLSQPRLLCLPDVLLLFMLPPPPPPGLWNDPLRLPPYLGLVSMWIPFPPLHTTAFMKPLHNWK